MRTTKKLKNATRPLPPGNRALPSAWLDFGFAEWKDCRSHELHKPNAADYRYYLSANADGVRSMWRDHDDSIKATAAEFAHEEGLSSFGATDTTPGTVLQRIARLLGWRVLPVAAKAASCNRDRSILVRYEAQCRDWASTADAIYKLIGQRQPATKDALTAAQWNLGRLRAEANKIAANLRDETALMDL